MNRWRFGEPAPNFLRYLFLILYLNMPRKWNRFPSEDIYTLQYFRHVTQATFNCFSANDTSLLRLTFSPYTFNRVVKDFFLLTNVRFPFGDLVPRSEIPMGREEDNEKEIFHDSFDTQEGGRKKVEKARQNRRLWQLVWYTQLPNGLAKGPNYDYARFFFFFLSFTS